MMSKSDDLKKRSENMSDAIINYFKSVHNISKLEYPFYPIYVKLFAQGVVVQLGYINEDSLFFTIILHSTNKGVQTCCNKGRDEININIETVDSLYEDDKLFQLSTMYDIDGFKTLYSDFGSLTTILNSLTKIRYKVYTTGTY